MSGVELDKDRQYTLDDISQSRKEKSLPQISTSPVAQTDSLRSIKPLKKPTNKMTL